MNVYKVTYKTKWSDSDRMEKGFMTVTAESAEAAIEKVKKLNSDDTFKDDDGKVFTHDAFQLQEVTLVAELDE